MVTEAGFHADEDLNKLFQAVENFEWSVNFPNIEEINNTKDEIEKLRSICSCQELLNLYVHYLSYKAYKKNDDLSETCLDNDIYAPIIKSVFHEYCHPKSNRAIILPEKYLYIKLVNGETRKRIIRPDLCYGG